MWGLETNIALNNLAAECGSVVEAKAMLGISSGVTTYIGKPSKRRVDSVRIQNKDGAVDTIVSTSLDEHVAVAYQNAA